MLCTKKESALLAAGGAPGAGVEDAANVVAGGCVVAGVCGVDKGAGVVVFPCLTLPNTALTKSATPPFAFTTSATMSWGHQVTIDFDVHNIYSWNGAGLHSDDYFRRPCSRRFTSFCLRLS